MAFKATNIIPNLAYQKVKGAASQLKINSAAFITQLSANGATYSFLRDIFRTIYNANASFDSLKTTPGLADYAKAQEDDSAYDVVAEFTAMQATITAALTWMNSNVPTSVTAVTPANWVTSENMIATSFTPAQTAGLRTLLQNIINAIE